MIFQNVNKVEEKPSALVGKNLFLTNFWCLQATVDLTVTDYVF